MRALIHRGGQRSSVCRGEPLTSKKPLVHNRPSESSLTATTLQREDHQEETDELDVMS